MIKKLIHRYPLSKELKTVIVACLIVTVWRIACMAFSPLNLFFDEAQYWHWAQNLDFGYFSKPPMVAWAIASTTAICGDGELCVKLGSSLAHLSTSIAVFFIGRLLYNNRVGLFSSIIFATLPGVSFSSMIISTDPFLMTFWAWGMVAFILAIQKDSLKYWALCGLFIGLGMLSKYAMIAFVLSMIIYFIWSGKKSTAFKSKGLWLSFAIGFLVYLPNIIWNASNGFVSYIHTTANANLSTESFIHPIKALEFLASQMGVFGPILFVMLISYAINHKRIIRTSLADEEWNEYVEANQKPENKIAFHKAAFLFSFALPLIIIMTIEGFLSRANANWAAPSYIAASALVAAVAIEQKKEKLLKLSIVLHIILASITLCFGAITQTAHQLTGFELTKRTDPLKRVREWDKIGDAVSTIWDENKGTTLLFNERKVITPMLYYVSPNPFDAVKWNPDGEIHDHYDLTTTMNDKIGKDFLLIMRHDGIEHYKDYFKSVKFIKKVSIPLYPDYERAVYVYRLNGFKGYELKN
ncbi:MAG: glycosyltransferase family 39 protein [Alphaproteobacteria bacterium]|nr:glycosyltransferase family 39 protein [Alphaproteobacteria bacterium]